MYVEDIFQNNSTHLLNLVDKFVRVTTIHNECREGTVYTIDPISESIVLVNDCDGRTSLDVVMRHIVKSVELNENGRISKYELLQKLFSAPSQDISEEEVSVQKKKVMQWLEKNRVPFVEIGEVLKIHDSLEIHPPYGIEQCVCSNTVILSRIKALLSSMPAN